MEEEKDEEIPEEIESVEEKKSNKIPAEKKHVSHSKGKLTGKMKENPWIISTLILGILFLFMVIIGNFSG